jgi:CHAD domain-containing protein
MSLLLTPRQIVTKMEENVKRVDNRLDHYIKDSNENNIHDIRTAVRRLDASYRSLPKNMRRKNKVSKYMRTSKRLFKINSQVRDYDIIYENYKNTPQSQFIPSLQDR